MATEDAGMKDFRDKLAEQMWLDYSNYLQK